MTEDNTRGGEVDQAALMQLHQGLQVMLPPLAGSLGIAFAEAAIVKIVDRLVEEEVLIAQQIMPSVIDPDSPRKEVLFQVVGTDGKATVRAPKRHPTTAEEALANACIVAMMVSPLVRGLLLLQGFNYQFAEPAAKAGPKIEIVRG